MKRQVKWGGYVTLRSLSEKSATSGATRAVRFRVAALIHGAVLGSGANGGFAMNKAMEDADMPGEIDFSQSMPNPYVGRISRRDVVGDNQAPGLIERMGVECTDGDAVDVH